MQSDEYTRTVDGGETSAASLQASATMQKLAEVKRLRTDRRDQMVKRLQEQMEVIRIQKATTNKLTAQIQDMEKSNEEKDLSHQASLEKLREAHDSEMAKLRDQNSLLYSKIDEANTTIDSLKDDNTQASEILAQAEEIRKNAEEVRNSAEVRVRDAEKEAEERIAASAEEANRIIRERTARFTGKERKLVSAINDMTSKSELAEQNYGLKIRELESALEAERVRYNNLAEDMQCLTHENGRLTSMMASLRDHVENLLDEELELANGLDAVSKDLQAAHEFEPAREKAAGLKLDFPSDDQLRDLTPNSYAGSKIDA